MSYFARYRDGQHSSVWKELVALGPEVRAPDLIDDATSVAQATMERVAQNLDRLVTRLSAHGYEFGIYPDGSAPAWTPGPLTYATPSSRAQIDELEARVGPLPLSLRAFWTVADSVDFIGRYQAGWPVYGDPLVVFPPVGGIAEFRDWQDDVADRGFAAVGPFRCPLAPDVLHKDNVSGGSPYSIALPELGADGLVCDEWHAVGFVDYLRTAILGWGGFPGLSPDNPQDIWRREQARQAPEWLANLTSDLLAF